MNRAFAYHVFAHKDGRYQTVYSCGTDAAELKALEQFFFGQTNDPGYLTALRTEPGIIWRRVGSRAALTRVTQGVQDSNGRPTFRFETLLDTDQGTSLVKHVSEVVLGEWEFTKTGAKVAPLSVGKTLPLNPAGISYVALAVRDGKRVLQPAKAFSLRDVAAIIEACAEESGFSLCFKSLNDRAPVRVNLVSRNISERTMPMAPPAKPNPLPRTQRTSFAHSPSAGTSTFALLAVCAVLIVQTFMLWRATGASSKPGTIGTAQEAIIGQLKQQTDDIIKQLKKESAEHATAIEQLKESIAVAKSTLDKLVSTSAEDRANSKTERGELKKSIEELGHHVTDLGKDLVTRTKKIASAHKSTRTEIQRIHDSQTATADSLEQLDDKVERLGEQFAPIKQILLELQRILDENEDDRDSRSPRKRKRR